MTEGIRVLPFRRSAFQVAVLMFVTLGFYVFVWAFFIRRACASLLEQEDQPLWKSIALIVPIFNLFLMFDLGMKVRGVQWRADPARVNGSLPWIGVSFYVFTIVGRLKVPFSHLGILNFVPVALIQQQFSRAQIALLGDRATPTPLHWLEWIAIAAGGAVWVLIVYGLALSVSADQITTADGAWFSSAVAVALAALLVFAVTSRRAVADGLAMHADPSPDRIAPYAD